MKRYLLFITFFMMAAVSFSSCKKDSGTDEKELVVTPTTLTFSATNETQYVTITTAGQWTAVSNRDWCTLSEGSGAGNASLGVSVAQNDDASSRSALVTIKSQTETVFLTVIQKTAAISASVDTMKYGTAGGSAYFKVQASEAWTASCEEEWVEFSPESGEGGDEPVSVKVSVAKNQTAEQREVTITLTTNSGSQATVIVSQAKGTSSGELGVSCEGFDLSASPSEMEILLLGKTYTLQVTTPSSSSQWDVTYDYPEGTEPFLTFSDIYSRIGSGDFTMTPSVNLSGESRTATVTINCTTDNEQASWQINVIQRGYQLTTTPASINPLSEEAQQIELAVSIDPQMDLAYSSDVDWITPVENEPGVWDVTANEGEESRSGNILILAAEDETITLATIPVTQNTGLQASDLTLEIPFQCNTYVTPIDPTSITTPSCHSSIIGNGGASDMEAGKMQSKTAWRKSYDAYGAQLSFYFRTELTGELNFGITASMADASFGVVNVSIGDVSYDVKVEGVQDRVYPVGRFYIEEPGYVRVNIKGVSASGNYYPYIAAFNVGGEAVGYASIKNANLTYVTEAQTAASAPHWIRRGPSCHLAWTQPSGNTEYFYNEIIVPEGEDIDGAYFMTTGFSGGYMGIQPNASGRVVLFSVWDTNTEAGQLGEVVRHGSDVTPNRFGHEGSGWQTFKYYNWKAGTKYATLVQIRPDPNHPGSSLYTGYFWSEERGWELLAEIRRPNETTYYKGAYSFSENFRPEQGWLPRQVTFTNQWMRTTDGVWHEITQAKVTADGTGSDGLRKDWYGGVDDEGNFFLKNIGYFNETIRYGTAVNRPTTGNPAPDIDFEALDKLGVWEE